MTFARVALDVPLATLFDYRADGASAADIGCRVLVPFGSRQRAGILMELAETSALPAARLKPVTRIVRDETRLPGDVLELFRFCAGYYHHPLGEVVLGGLPQGLRRAGATLPVERRWLPTPLARTDGPSRLPPRKILPRRVLEMLLAHPRLSIDQLKALSPRALGAMRELVALGLAEERIEIAPPALPALPIAPIPAPVLTDEQSQAVAAIDGERNRFRCWLLQGVTGSGKTEVYLRLIAETLQQGRQALVLVPEIGLTPQLAAAFRARFARHSLVWLHSGLGEGERLRHWLAAAQGQADVVLGTRLAVFTPLPRLGLVVVDEEHDTSFKQQEGLRYSARDLAVYRGRQRNVPVVLGSATPSLESTGRALAGRYGLLRLTRRAKAEAPRIRLVDTGKQPLVDGFAEPSLAALRENVAARGQSLVFLNRRGYAPALLCRHCRWCAGCRRCTARLVLHWNEGALRCHHCGHREKIPAACPECGNQDLAPVGHGTQRVEQTLQRHLPGARVLRIDRDSTRRKNAWAELREAMATRAVDVLVGTQMLAKGHDFPHLNLVCVLNADASLFSPDYRSGERLFAQLMQVSGRAGRDRIPGEVLIQTEFPDHPLFAALRAQDYSGFAQRLLAERRQAGFPPYAHEALLRAEARTPDPVLAFLRLAAQSTPPPPEVTLYDPVPAAMPRLAGKERGQLLIQSTSRKALQRFLSAWQAKLADIKAPGVRWGLDVDPIEF